MTIDHRKLLKDCIRGMIYEWDIPAMPCAIGMDGIAIPCTDEELELFDKLVVEVLTEEEHTTQSIIETIAAMKRGFMRMRIARDADGNCVLIHDETS
jgi:hypothetical protein